MRIGLFLAYWPWFSPQEQVELARQADREGLDSVWVSEAWGQDAATVLGHISALTERVGLGSGLFQIPARTPAMTAMTAATLDTLSEGRFRLGLGVSGPQVSEGWHGVSFARPLARTREYVEIVRAALAREGALSYEGEEYRLPVEGTGLGKPLRAADQARHAPTSRSTSARSGRSRSSRPAGSPTAGSRSSSTPARPDESWSPVGGGRTRGRRLPRRAALRRRRPRGGARHGPAVADRSTSAAWAPSPRTSTWRQPSGWDRASRRGRCRSCSGRRPRGRRGGPEPEIIDAAPSAAAPAIDDRLAAFEAAGADTLLACRWGPADDRGGPRRRGAELGRVSGTRPAQGAPGPPGSRARS